MTDAIGMGEVRRGQAPPASLRNGTRRNVRFPIIDQTGAVMALRGIATDITEHVRSEASHADTRLILEGIVNNSPAVIYVKRKRNTLPTL